MIRRFSTATLALATATLFLAACGSAQTETVSHSASPAQLTPNYATVLESPSGNLFTEARAYQHGQVLEAKKGVIRLMTPQGVSTRGGVGLTLAPGGQTAWAPVIAERELYVSPIFVGPIDNWKPAELTTAVAPFPGSVLPADATTAVAIVGAKSHGASHQELVRVHSSGSITQILATDPTLEHLLSSGHCKNPVYESLAGSASSPTLLARCGATNYAALVSPLSGTSFIDRAPSGTEFIGLSALTELSGGGHPVAAAVIAPTKGGGSDALTLISKTFSAVSVKLKGRPVASPSFAISSTGEWALVPLAGGNSQVVEFSPTGRVLGSAAGPKNAQGVGVSTGGHALVVAANPNKATITLWRDSASGFVKGGSLSVPQGVNG
jgi:hypothetical protein